MNIIIRPNDCNYIFEDILLNRFENVSNYFYTPLVSELYLSLKQKNDLISLDKTEEIYFMFDSPGEDAFAHWVYESFIFYPMLQKLNEKYKNIETIVEVIKNDSVLSQKYEIPQNFEFLKIREFFLHPIPEDKEILNIPKSNGPDLNNLKEFLKTKAFSDKKIEKVFQVFNTFK